MRLTIKYILLSHIVLLTNCTKKVDLNIKEQTKAQLVIFGLLSNDKEDNKVTLTLSENYRSKTSSGKQIADLKLISIYDTVNFTQTKDTTYVLNSILQPFSEYIIECNYNGVKHEYSAITSAPAEILNAEFVNTTNGKKSLVCNLSTYLDNLDILPEVYVGKIQPLSADTIWTKYNNYYPNSSSKIKFLTPINSTPDNDGNSKIEILKEGDFIKGDIVKTVIYCIDDFTSSNLSQIFNENNYEFNPMSIAPPKNVYYFSNEALGIVILSMKSAMISKVP